MSSSPKNQVQTGILVLANGEVFHGTGCGSEGNAVAEVCFNTAMTGYQEILTDPSYAEQIICFTFPHIGNTGTNAIDEEASSPAALSASKGVILRENITTPSSWRAQNHLNDWLKERGIIGLCGVDTRALTAFIRDNGMPNGVIAHKQEGKFDIDALVNQAKAWNGVVGADLAQHVSTNDPISWVESKWNGPTAGQTSGYGDASDANKHVVVIDYGVKRNILRCLASAGIRSTVVSAQTSAEDILAFNPDGIVLSNGPGDPEATGAYSLDIIRKLTNSGKPIFGICLGHQMLALSLGAKTVKMEQGHHGANHPVMDFETGKVEIVSMNHGFAVDTETLPKGVVQTHRSLFDGTNCGLRVENKPIFSVQHHPEASPGPKDSFYIFERFAATL